LYPDELLAGEAMNPESPRRFLFIDDEVRAGGGELDLLFLDQSAIPTLVETKRAINPICAEG